MNITYSTPKNLELETIKKYAAWAERRLKQEFPRHKVVVLIPGDFAYEKEGVATDDDQNRERTEHFCKDLFSLYIALGMPQ